MRLSESTIKAAILDSQEEFRFTAARYFSGSFSQNETIMPQVVEDMRRGTVRHAYTTSNRPDITRVPLPRWELIDFRNYVTMSVQFSRGCPFDCEFCDIIVMNGRIVTSDGLPVIGGFQPVPAGTTNITIGSNGNVTYTGAAGTTTFQVQLVRFNNPAGLESEGSNLYKETAASGTPELGTPGSNGFGTLNQGYLELSNVSVVEEMVNLIQAQRAYEVNSKAVQACDEMMQQSNNLIR